MYSKHAPFTATVGMLIVKLPAPLLARIGAVLKVSAGLQVTLSTPPSAVFGVIKTMLFTEAAVVFTWHVPALEATSQ